jgi:hypothetical protein
VPGVVDGGAGRAVQQEQIRGLPLAESGAHICALCDSGREVVGGESGVHGAGRVGGGVESDDQDALGTRLGDGAEHTGGVARGDQDALHLLRDQVVDRVHLALVVAVELAGQRDQLGTLSGRLLLGGVPQLDEVGIGVGLGDQADRHLPSAATRGRRGTALRRRAG